MLTGPDDFDDIKHYFEENEWRDMSDYDKGSYLNSFNNYNNMIKFGEWHIQIHITFG